MTIVLLCSRWDSVCFWQIHALSLQQYNSIKSATGLEFKVSAASAPLLLMQICQPVIKPQLHVLQARQGLDGLCLFLTDPRNQAWCVMPARVELVKLVSCRLYA